MQTTRTQYYALVAMMVFGVFSSLAGVLLSSVCFGLCEPADECDATFLASACALSYISIPVHFAALLIFQSTIQRLRGLDVQANPSAG